MLLLNPDALVVKLVAPVKVAADTFTAPESIGVVSVGDVPNTNAPVPVSFVTAANRFAEDGVSKKVRTPVPIAAQPRLTPSLVKSFPVDSAGIATPVSSRLAVRSEKRQASDPDVGAGRFIILYPFISSRADIELFDVSERDNASVNPV